MKHLGSLAWIAYLFLSFCTRRCPELPALCLLQNSKCRFPGLENFLSSSFPSKGRISSTPGTKISSDPSQSSISVSNWFVSAVSCHGFLLSPHGHGRGEFLPPPAISAGCSVPEVLRCETGQWHSCPFPSWIFSHTFLEVQETSLEALPESKNWKK